MNKTYASWLGPLALAVLINIANIAPASAQTSTKPQPRKSSPRTTTAYSASRAQSRRAVLARARAAAVARETRSTVLPRFKFDDTGAVVPDLHAEAAVIYDPETNQVLWEQHSQEPRSIASITKVMTATVFLESDPDRYQQVSITRSDVYQASTTYLRANDRVTVDDLLHLLLIASDNAAARALARVSPFGTTGFVRRMNEKAMELDLDSTHYADPSGLLSDNVSSAYDMARLIAMASEDERIASIMRTPEYSFFTAQHRLVSFHTTNHLLGMPNVDVRAGKTGFIAKAGYCLATLLQMPENGPHVAVVVLGARSNAGRFLETRNLFEWLSAKAATLFSATPASPRPSIP